MDVVTLGAALNGAKAYTDATIAPLLGGVHYRGSVNYFNTLPSNPSEGDAYTVKYSGTSGTSPDGTEYVWALDTEDNTYKWIGFSPDTYTKAEVDNLLSGKQDSIVFNTAYDATNNKAATMSDVPAAGSSTPQMDGTGAVGSSDNYARADHVHPTDTSRQAALTTAQLDAVNSGIDSTKVAQIETNKTNILSLADSGGAKNKIYVDKLNTTNANGVTYTINNDGTVTVNGTPSGTSPSYVVVAMPDGGTYKDFSEYCNGDYILSGCPKNGSSSTYRMYITGTGYTKEDYGSGVELSATAVTPLYLIIYIYNGYTADNLIFKPMICTKSMWNVSHTYQPSQRTVHYTEITIKLSDVNWTQSGSGEWYSTAVTVPNATTIVGIMWIIDAYIRDTDRITPHVSSSDRSKIGLYANTGTFTHADSSVTFLITYL